MSWDDLPIDQVLSDAVTKEPGRARQRRKGGPLTIVQDTTTGRRPDLWSTPGSSRAGRTRRAGVRSSGVRSWPASGRAAVDHLRLLREPGGGISAGLATRDRHAPARGAGEPAGGLVELS